MIALSFQGSTLQRPDGAYEEKLLLSSLGAAPIKGWIFFVYA